MRTGIFGGSFNPVHNGHLHLADAYTKALSLDRLLIIPNHFPPHKSSSELADGQHRLHMCSLAFSDSPVCEVSDLELHRPGRSFTIDSLRLLAEKNPDEQRFLLMGSDMYLSFQTWRGWNQIGQLAVLCAGVRDPAHFAALRQQQARLESEHIESVIVPIQPLVISSTQIRAAVRAGKDIGSFVPPAVAKYIAENRLYL